MHLRSFILAVSIVQIVAVADPTWSAEILGSNEANSHIRDARAGSVPGGVTGVGDKLLLAQAKVRTRSRAELPDLTIRRVWLDRQCRINVQITNSGKREIAKRALRQSTLSLRYGKQRIPISLRKIDPRQRLSRPGASLSFRSKVRLKNRAVIVAIVDSRNTIKEVSERNNVFKLKVRKSCIATAGRKSTTAQKSPRTGRPPDLRRPQRVDKTGKKPSGRGQIKFTTKSLRPNLDGKKRRFGERQVAASARLRIKIANANARAKARRESQIKPAVALKRYLAQGPVPGAAAPRTPDGPRITSSTPAPVSPGHELRITGQQFGSSGRVMLDFAGLYLQLPTDSWSNRQIRLRIPVEIRPFVGEAAHEARLWVHADTGAATKTLQIGPDRPRIQRVGPSVIEPGVDITIEGDRFLTEQPGTVELECLGYETSRGTVIEWTQTVVGVRFFPTPGRSLNQQRCQIVLKNHLGHEARKRARLTVQLDREEIRYHVRPRLLLERRRGEPVTAGDELSNGWGVRGTQLSWSDDGVGVSVSWGSRPTRGATNTRAQFEFECRSAYGPIPGCPLGNLPSLLLYTVELEGPLGLPYFGSQ